MDNKYTEFIENYLTNDKTKSAIMLIGGWGTGKSYYIQNVLKPYLESKKEDCCVIVSLYGLNDLKDISKSIYLDVRTKKIDEKISSIKVLQKAESQAGAKIIGKTIVKGVASFLNIDLSGSEDDFRQLYESIDLSGKLIILEDLERSNIPIKDVLGYVNNLVEQDGVKVLLVANENEILKKEEVIVGKDKDGNDNKELRWTDETQEYFKIKEKTISDTIYYVCDYFEAIENILNQFKDETLEALLLNKLETDSPKEGKENPITAEELNFNKQMLYLEIMSIAEKICNLNFRSFIFACQKTVNILRLYNKEIDKTFVKYLFMSIVAFSFRLKKNDKLYWNDKENGNSLGTSKYPLYKFAHDYIKYQTLNSEIIFREEEDFLAQRKANSIQDDVQVYLNILFDFHSTTSLSLEVAVGEIRKHLDKTKVIDTIIYGKLANYLIIARDLITTPSLVDDCKAIMKRNLQTDDYDGEKINDRLSFHDRFRFWTPEQEKEYNDFIGELQLIVKTKRNNELNFDYDIKNFDTFVKEIIENRDDYINQHTFLKRIDVCKFIDVLKQCTSQQIHEFRRAIGTVYSFSNINDYYMEDKPSLIQLRDGVMTLLESKEYTGDKINRLQLSWFIDNLNNILERLS